MDDRAPRLQDIIDDELGSGVCYAMQCDCGQYCGTEDPSSLPHCLARKNEQSHLRSANVHGPQKTGISLLDISSGDVRSVAKRRYSHQERTELMMGMPLELPALLLGRRAPITFVSLGLMKPYLTLSLYASATGSIRVFARRERGTCTGSATTER